MDIIEKILEIFHKKKEASPKVPSSEIKTTKKVAPKEIGHSIAIVSDVKRKDYSMLTNHINMVSMRQIKDGKKNYSRLGVAIGGYDNDPRPLWNIPEVVSWYRDLHNKYPYMPMFLSPGSIQVYFKVLQPIAKNILPKEFKNNKDLVGLLLHVFSARNIYFSSVLGNDYERLQYVLKNADKIVSDAVEKLTKGIDEPF